MSHDVPQNVPDPELYRQTQALLEPGDINLAGVILHTPLESDEEPAMTELTVSIGEALADLVTDEDIYVYSGNDDPDFGANQHQGLTLTDDAFVWECQQLYRNGSYDLIFYFEAGRAGAELVDHIEADHDVTAVFVPDPAPDRSTNK